MPELLFLNEGLSGTRYPLQLERTSVGRAQDNTLVIQHSSISQYHCEILTYGDEVIVRDLDSTNGTFLNGARLKPQAGARSGNVIRFGEVKARLVFEPLPDPADDEPADATAIHDHAKIVREQRRTKARPVPDPKATLQPEHPLTPTDATQAVRKPPSPSVASPTVPLEPAPSSSGKGGSLWWWVLGLVGAALLIGLIIALMR